MARSLSPSAGAAPAGREWTRWLAFAAACAMACGTYAAREVPELPAPVVLVLELVSSTHVKPTTGVVIGERNLVLIPSDFVSAGDEIVVLDGGTDIVRNGRPARTVGRIAEEGLAVLSVDGLSRAPVTLSADAPMSGSRLTFTGFPPAREIAEGTGPIFRPVSLAAGADGAGWAGGEPPLPNVAGPLFDACGFLAGYNLPSGLPSLEGDARPRTLSSVDIARILRAMEFEVTPTPCESAPPSPTGDTGTEPDEPATQPGGQEPDPEGPGPGGDAADEGEVTPADGEASSDVTPDPAGYPPAVGRDAGTAEATPGHYRSAIALGLLIALVAVLTWRRAARRRRLPVTVRGSQEPATVALVTGPAENVGVQRVPGREPVRDFSPEPDGTGPLLRVDATLPDGTRLRRFLAVTDLEGGAVLGRSGTDIDLPSPAVSRRHARLRVEGEEIMVTDLGSSNGTWVRSCPCLPGELLYVEPGDEVVLADVRLRLQLHQRRKGDR